MSPDWERFWAKVNRHGPTAALRPDLGPCWLWTAGKYDQGYGQWWCQGGGHHAHRWLYERMHGPIPAGLVLDHFACERRDCIRPTHVRPVTIRENVLRSAHFSSDNLAKTHCKHGHEFRPENTYVIPARLGGGRSCKECRRQRDRARIAANPEAHRTKSRESMRRWKQRQRELATAEHA